jgi:PBSX family phage terminase large subunit
MTSIFKKTDRQREAIKLLGNELLRYVMLYGGSRSGKTFIAVFALCVRASKVKSRHIILRLKFNHAKTSIWLDTLPKVLRICFPDLKVEYKASDYYILFPNGSEIWIGGLDDAERVEKILGKEYSTIYFNECSQIPYRSIEMALTRLAEKNDLRKKAYFDENPPTKKHWSYWLFIKGLHPDTLEPIKKDNYGAILMNPKDNIENIDEDYITEILNNLSENEVKRFRDGEFLDSDEGQAYHSFQREINVHSFDKRYANGTIMVGMDFNVNPMTAVVGYYQNNTFYVVDEIYLENSDTYKMSGELIKRGYKSAFIYPDSTGKNRKTSGRSDHLILKDDGFIVKDTRNPFVKDRVNNINRLLRDGRIIIDPKCKRLIMDLERVVWDGNDLDKRSDPNLTHISDALGYWCWAVDNIVYKAPAPIRLT